MKEHLAIRLMTWYFDHMWVIVLAVLGILGIIFIYDKVSKL